MRFKFLVTMLTVTMVTLLWSSLGLQVYNFGARENVQRLGYVGPVVEVVALYDPETGTGSGRLGRVVENYDLSLAFERQLDTGVLTILDPSQRFMTGSGPLVPDHLASDPGASWIGVNEVISAPEEQVAMTIALNFQGTVLAPISSDLLLFTSAQALYVSSDVQPFVDGRYYFAGDFVGSPDGIDILLGLMSSMGFSIVAVTPFDDPSSISAIIASNVGGLFGVVVVSFLTATLLSIYVVARTYVAGHREKLHALAVCGADQRGLRASVFRTLIRTVGLGVAVSLMISVSAVFYLSRFSSGSVWTQMLVVLVATVVSGLLLTSVSRAVAWSEARRVAHVLPV